MSYCVNCGVELDTSLKKCPLCSTPVINPNKLNEENFVLPTYPIENAVAVVRTIRKLAALLVSAVLLTGLLLCPLCDYVINNTLTWSRYVIPSVIFTWCCAVPPIIIRHNAFLKCIVIDFITAMIYLYTMNKLTTPSVNWFIQICLPMLLYCFFDCILFDVLARYPKHNVLCMVALGFVMAGIFCVMTEYLTRKFMLRNMEWIWSVPVLISCLGMAVLLVIISRLAQLSSVRKRLHI